jgi:LPXTG-motif cell wall-anchored protein
LKHIARTVSLVWLFAFALVLLVSPLQVLAYDNHTVAVSAQADGNTIQVDGKVTGGGTEPAGLEGKFVFALIDKEQGVEKDRADYPVAYTDATTSAVHTFENVESGDYYVKVRFEGAVKQGDDVKIEGDSNVVTVGDPNSGAGDGGDITVGGGTDSNNDTISSNNNDVQDKVHQKDIDIDAFPLDSEDGVTGTKVNAVLNVMGAQQAGGSGINGDWTITITKKSDGTVVDEKSKSGHEGPSYEDVLNVTEEGQYVVKVTFDGTVDGAATKGAGTKEYSIPEPSEEPVTGDEELKTGYSFENGKHVLTTVMLNAEEAHGDWLIAFVHEDNVDHPIEDQIIWDEKVGHDRVTASYEFDKLKPGRYYGISLFAGEADGEVTGLYEEFEFTVAKDGTIKPDPGNEDKGSGKIDPDQAKKHINDIKGGQMPKTGSEAPMGTYIGLGVLLLGVGIFAVWKLRTRMTNN